MNKLFGGIFFVLILLSDKAAMAQRTVTLEELFSLADQQSQSIKSYQTAQEAAAQQVASARAQRLPDVNLSLSGSYIGNATLLDRSFSTHGTADIYYAIAPYVGTATLGKQDTPHWGNSFAFQASQVLYAGGAISAGVRLAELGEQMAALDVQRQRQEVRFLLAGHYLDLCKLDNQRQALERNIELAEALLANMQSRMEQGTALQNDILRFELMLESLRLAKRQVEDAARIVGHQICTTLHIDGEIKPATSEESSLYAAGTSAMTVNEASWQDRALQSNLGLRQASLAGDVSRQQLKLAKSAQLPKVMLVAEDHLDGPYTNDLIPVDANANAWFIGLGVQYNLGSLWRSRHDVKRARLDVQRSGEELAVAREGIDNGVQACFVALQTCHENVATQMKSVELAERNYRTTSLRYDEGLSLLTDMLDASNTKLAADVALVNARIDLIYNYLKLKYIINTL